MTHVASRVTTQLSKILSREKGIRTPATTPNRTPLEKVESARAVNAAVKAVGEDEEESGVAVGGVVNREMERGRRGRSVIRTRIGRGSQSPSRSCTRSAPPATSRSQMVA
jgi:hypothetical protein